MMEKLFSALILVLFSLDGSAAGIDNPNFIQSGTGAVARTYSAKAADLISVKDFGAIGNGITDDSAAIQKAIDAQVASCGTAYLPAGKYALASTITLKPCVSVRGESEFAAVILPKTASMTVFSLVFGSASGANLSISDLSIQSGAIAGVKGFQFTHANRVHLSNIVFFGCATNAEFDRGGLHRISNIVSAGTGTLKSGSLKLWSSTDTEYGAVFTTIDNYRIENNGMGVQSPAVYFRRAVGVRVSRLVTNDGDYTGTAILIENDSQGINISNSLIIGYSLGVVFQKGGGIDKAPIVNVLNDVDFDQNSTNAVLMTAGKGNQIVGGSITSSAVATGAQAIVLNGAAATENTIRGVHIGGYYTGSGTGIYLNNTTYNRIYNVQVEGSVQGIAFGGTNTNTHIANSDFSSSVTTPIAGSISGIGNRVIDVKGFVASSLITSPAMAASNATVRNDYGVPVRVLVYGGTVNVVKVNGQSIGFTNQSVLLMPGETIAIDYSVAPSWNWVGV